MPTRVVSHHCLKLLLRDFTDSHVKWLRKSHWMRNGIRRKREELIFVRHAHLEVSGGHELEIQAYGICERLLINSGIPQYFCRRVREGTASP